MLILSIGLMIVAAALVATTIKVLNNAFSVRTIASSIGFGVIAGAINYLSAKVIGWSVGWIAIILFVIALAAMAILATHARRDAATLKEFGLLALLELLTFFVARTAASAVCALFQNIFWKSVVMLIPTVGLVLVMGLFVANFCSFRFQNGMGNGWRVGSIVATIVTIAAIILLLIFVPEWSGVKATKTTETTVALADAEEVVEEVEEVSWYGFYNPSLLNDDDEANNYNFGYNYFSEEKSASDYDADFRERIKVDPALGAADMAWLDANLGTRYMGQFYDECDGAWDKAINDAKDGFMADQTGYYDTITAFFAYLDTAEVSIAYSDDELNDQMYMNPYTVSGIPDVVVYETDDHAGWFLVYTFNIKGTKVEVAYRIDCGYQPTDVSEVMDVVPQENPSNKTTSGDGNPTPASTSEPTPTPTPEPEPEPTPTYDKDKTQGTQGDLVAPNDDPGPGEDTNNGVGAQESTKESDSSNHITYDEYVAKNEALEEINEAQQTGDGGTADIDQPTNIITPAKTTTDEEIETEPGGILGEPID